MKARIIRVGKGWGIRIPPALLEQTGLSGEVDITAEGGAIIIRAERNPRAGWDAAFKEMGPDPDDLAGDSPAPSLTSWDDAEWEW
jgi:antitoxin component of MazEF toxin-antitoxin module